MKARYTLTTLICATLFLGSCQDDPLFNAPGKGIRITASLTPDTRIAYTEGESSIRCTWETKDAIGLSTANQANLKYQAVAGGETANFTPATSSDILTAGDGETIYAYYPYSTENEQYEVEGEDYATAPVPDIFDQYLSDGLRGNDFVYATGKLADNTCLLSFKHLFTYLKIDVDIRELQEPQEPGQYKGLYIESTEPTFYFIYYPGNTYTAKFSLAEQKLITDPNQYKDAPDFNVLRNINYWINEENATNDSIITCYIAMLPQPEGAVISIRDANAYENQIYDDRHVPEGGLQSGRMYSLGLSDTINAVVNTTYDLYIAWEISGIVDTDNGIFFNPDLSMPADWYEASFTPISQRIETYEDGSRRGSTWNDYGFLSAPASFTEAHFYEDVYTAQYAGLPETIFPKELSQEYIFEGNDFSKVWYGAAREVYGLNFYNVTTTEDKHVYCYYDNGERNESHTPFTEDYGKCTPTGPNRIYLTEEQVQKLNAYFGHEITYGELIELTAEEFIRILGTGHLENPYLGIPEGAYSMAYGEDIILNFDGAKTWRGTSTQKLAYGIEFIHSDGFFVLSDKDSIMMQTYPRNISKPEYKVEMEILSDDAEKTVGVLKMTASQFFQYENTLNGFPDIVNIYVDEWGVAYEGINYDDYYYSFHFSQVGYDTLVTYKYAEDVPFKVRNHYYYCGQYNSFMGGDIPIELNPKHIIINEQYGLPMVDWEWEIISEADWIQIDTRFIDNVVDHEEGFPYIYCGFAVTQNNNREYRVGYITIGIKGSDYKERVRVVQHGGDLAIGNSETHHFDYTGGTFYATGQTNHGTDELWPSIDVDWVHLGAETRGMSDFQLGPFYVDENTSTQPRETMFRIYDDNGEICKITVTQDGCPAEMTKAVRSSRPSESKAAHPQYRKARAGLQKDVIVVPYR